MKTNNRTFAIEVGKSAIIGISPGSTPLTISLGGGKTYSAPIEKVHAALQRWHAREHPTGRKPRRFLTHSDQMKKSQ
jgi:hypothetical protein